MERRNKYLSQAPDGGAGGYSAGKRVYSDEETRHNLKGSDETGENDGGPGNGAGNAGNAANAGGLGGGNTGGMQGSHLTGGFEGDGPEESEE